TYTITNPPPVAENDALTGDEDTPVTVDLFADNGAGNPDRDPDGDTFTVTRAAPGNTVSDLTPLADGTGVGTPLTGSGGGTFTVQPNGTVAFDPGIDFQDLDVSETRTTEIVYQIDDGQGGTDTAVVTYTVTGVNDVPEVIDPLNPGNPLDPNTPADPNNIIPDQTGDDQVPLTPLDVSPYFTDVDGEPLTFGFNPADPNVPTWLTIDPVTGIITGTPPSDASQGGPNSDGVYPITIVVMDPDGAVVTTTVDFTISNPPPVAEDDVLTTDEDTPATGSLFADNGNGTDKDPDGDTIKVSQINGQPLVPGQPITLPSGALLTVQPDGSYAYDPNGQFESLGDGDTASDSFTYEITDGEGGFSTAVANLTITGVNDPPIAEDDTYTTPEDVPLTFDPRDNDTDPENDPLTVTEVDGQPVTPGGPSVPVEGGTVTLNPDGTLTFDPTPDYFGTPSFTYTIADPDGLTSTATVDLTVTPVPDRAPDIPRPSERAPAPDPEPLADLVVNPIVVNTVEQLGGFDARPTLTPGASTVTRITDIDRLRERLASIEERHGFAANPFDVSGLTGYSLRTDVSGITGTSRSNQGAQVIVDTLMRDNRLFVEITNTMDDGQDRTRTAYSVEPVDGGDLPVWLEEASNGLLLAEVPVDKPIVDLRIKVTLPDGSFVEQVVRIESASGEIQPLAEQGRVEQTGGFTEQLGAAEKAERERIRSIDRALQLQPGPR
ncbi:MAG: Ig-like domain-containing protein, partial [Pseudomonadota bacterium]